MSNHCLPQRGHLYPHDRYIEQKYLYLDSESRDPSTYPNPAEFSISRIDSQFSSYHTVQNTLHIAASLQRLTIPAVVIPAGTKELFVHLGSQNDKNDKIIVTNNRHLNDALFIVPINESPVNGFYHLRNSDMTQRVRFKLDDYINFRVFTRDGETLSIADTDPVDPDLQITALFEIAPKSIATN